MSARAKWSAMKSTLVTWLPYLGMIKHGFWIKTVQNLYRISLQLYFWKTNIQVSVIIVIELYSGTSEIQWTFFIYTYILKGFFDIFLVLLIQSHQILEILSGNLTFLTINLLSEYQSKKITFTDKIFHFKSCFKSFFSKNELIFSRLSIKKPLKNQKKTFKDMI